METAENVPTRVERSEASFPEAEIIRPKAATVWGVLRLMMGFTFLWALLDKLLALGFSTGRNPETGAIDFFGKDAWINGGSPTDGVLQFALHQGAFRRLLPGPRRFHPGRVGLHALDGGHWPGADLWDRNAGCGHRGHHLDGDLLYRHRPVAPIQPGARRSRNRGRSSRGNRLRRGRQVPRIRQPVEEAEIVQKYPVLE